MKYAKWLYIILVESKAGKEKNLIMAEIFDSFVRMHDESDHLTNFKNYYIYADMVRTKTKKNIYVPEMSTEETYKLLKIIKFSFEKTHNVHFGDKIIKNCIDLSNKFILNKKFPDKAIDIIDNCGSIKKKKTYIKKK